MPDYVQIIIMKPSTVTIASFYWVAEVSQVWNICFMHALISSAQQLWEMPAFLSFQFGIKDIWMWDLSSMHFILTNMTFIHFFLISIHIMLWIDSPSICPSKCLHKSIVAVLYKFNEVGRFFPLISKEKMGKLFIFTWFRIL